MFTTTLNGSYPRLPDPPRPQHLAKAFEDFRKSRISDREMEHAMERATVEAVGEMVAAGLDVVSDGQIRWEGPYTRLLSALDGFEVDQGNNGQTVSSLSGYSCVSKPIRWTHPIVSNDYRFLAERSPVPVRPALTGPYSLAKACNSGIYEDDFTLLCKDIAHALNREIEGLQELGAKYILIEEPLLKNLTASQFSGSQSNAKELALFSDVSSILCENIDCSIMLGTSECDLRGLYELILELRYGGIAFDLVDIPENKDLLLENRTWGDRILQLGLIDPNNPKIETSMEIAISLVEFASYNNPGLLWVAPAAGMSNISRSVAFDKLTNMCQGVQWARRELARREQPGGHI